LKVGGTRLNGSSRYHVAPVTKMFTSHSSLHF
jgi:hypothetical protein